MKLSLPDKTSDMLERAGWTFVEAALSVLLLAGFGYIDVATVKVALAAGLAAAASVVKSYAKTKMK